MTGGGEQVADHVLFPAGETGNAPSAPLLGFVYVGGLPFHIAVVGHGDHAVLFGDQILDVHLAGDRLDLGAATVVEFIFKRDQLFFDDAVDPVFVGQNVQIIGDLRLNGRQLILDLGPLQTGKLSQTHGNDGGSLTRAELAVVYKSLAVGTWDKLGVDNPKEETAGAMLMSTALPDNRVETSNPGEIMNIKMNVALMANVAYMIGDLYANDNFNLTNGLAYFDASSTMEGQSHEHAFKIETYLDLDADKLYFEGIINTDDMDQYSYLVADFDFDTNTLKSFRFCCSVVGNYVDMGLSEDNKFLFYS